MKGGIQFLKHQTNDYIWLQLCKEFFGLKQDIFICDMYNHPADSSYSRALDLYYFDVLEKEITDFSRQGQIILGGDLDARTGSLPDFITEDNDDHLPLILISRGRHLMNYVSKWVCAYLMAASLVILWVSSHHISIMVAVLYTILLFLNHC